MAITNHERVGKALELLKNVVRVVTENSRTLKFTSQGFEES